MVRNDRKKKSKESFKFKRKKKICVFCADKNSIIDYKEGAKFRKFLSDRGKILPRRITGTCTKHQRKLTQAIKRARHLALLPYLVE